MKSNLEQGVVFASPKDIDERGRLAESCVRTLNIRLPALLDGFDNRTEQAYTAWPERLFVIDREGKVAHKSAAGPYGFHPTEMETALAKLVD